MAEKENYRKGKWLHGGQGEGGTWVQLEKGRVRDIWIFVVTKIFCILTILTSISWL
jgi:hypothetical protein